jgi:hypothetical protein
MNPAIQYKIVMPILALQAFQALDHADTTGKEQDH